jgi:hypothetical protein
MLSLLGLFFDTEELGSMFLQNVGELAHSISLTKVLFIGTAVGTSDGSLLIVMLV